ncbi:MAG: TetR/AcrR family transcriptional regulator [Acidimicrobiia bacterium]
MPRIEAPTVVEHHAARAAELSRLAVEIVETDGAAALTLAELARRAGLSRPSLYSYFQSRDDLMTTICEQAVTVWAEEVIASMEVETDPLLRLRAFVTAQLEAAAESKHQAAFALLESGLSPEGHERVMAAHAPLQAALRQAVEQIGLEAAAAVVPMVQAVVSSAYGQIRAGADADQVMRGASLFIEGGLGALIDPG